MGLIDLPYYNSASNRDALEILSLCLRWAVRELGISLTDLARRLELSVPAIGYAVERGRSLQGTAVIDCWNIHLRILRASL
jgi:hypothetical protein